jgi:hypothetical protein
MRATTLLSVFASLFLLGITEMALSGERPKTEKADVPELWLNPPKDPAFHFIPVTANSRDLSMATDKCKMEGVNKISQLAKAKFRVVVRNMRNEVPADLDSLFDSRLDSLTRKGFLISNVKPHQTWNTEENGLYRVFILYAYPVLELNKTIIDKIKSDQQFYAIVRETATFKGLETGEP